VRSRIALGDLEIYESLSAAARIAESVPVHICTDGLVVPLRHQQAERETAEHHLDRSFPSSLFELDCHEFRNERQIPFREPEIGT
jgi:hypothetical protein